MLRSLHIENVAVIKSAEIDFSKGFSALTGETGAGKSILIDSINLLLGNRIPKDLIRSGEERAAVSAVFEDLGEEVCQKIEELGFFADDKSVMLQRTLSLDGRSQCRINGQSVTLGVLKEIAGTLLSIHGQSDSQKLLQKSAHLSLLDAYAHPEVELTEYGKCFAELKEVREQLRTTSQNEAEKLRLLEMLRFQISDIDALKLKNGEEEAAEKEKERLLHLEKINKQSDFVHRILSAGEKGNVVDLLRRAETSLESLDGLVEGAVDLAGRLAQVRSEVLDVSETVAGFVDDDREDPTARIDRLEERLEAISKLKRKYGNSIGEILSFREKAQKELDGLELSDEKREALAKKEKELEEKASVLAEKVSILRKKSAKEAVEKVTETLRFLDMPNVRFEIRILSAPLGENGSDDVEFMIATNPGEPLQPLIKIASGGELSRIMLSLRSVIADRDGAETVIFDEIDTGVSGKTSRKIGLKLHEIAEETQVFCVTHSAQIASLADRQFRILKTEKDGRAETSVLPLSDEERVEEIARILGGIEVTASQRDAAQELLSEYRKG